MPLRSVQTVRIVTPYKPLSEIRCGNILSLLDEMQFMDRIRTEKCLYDVFSDRNSLSNRTDREAVFTDRISLSTLDNPRGVTVAILKTVRALTYFSFFSP